MTDPGHLLPAAAWAAVVADAEAQAERIAAGHPAPEAPRRTAGRYGTGALPLSGQVAAPSNGGRRKRGAPTFGVLHTAETPLAGGYAAAIARYFGTGPGTSCHYMTDPAETWGVLADELVAWHCGTGNPNSVALEQSGRAAMTRAQWLAPAGRAQLQRNAAVMRACRDRYGIGLHWMTDQQLRDAHAGRIVGGWATHDQCRRVLGGTTHTDVGPGFPVDVQMALAADTSTEDETMAALDDLARDEAIRHTTVTAELTAHRGILTSMDAKLDRVLAALEKGGTAGAVAGGLTEAQVEAAVRRVFADGGQA